MKSSYTEVTLRLENIVVTDLNPRTIHTKILSIIDEDAMTVQLVMFNLEETSEYNSDNMKINVTMGCAKIIFMNWFVTSVLNFLDHFQTAQERIKEASKAAAEAAKQNVVAAYEQATRIKMNIKIKAPIILVPVHSQSLEAIVIDLGNLKITNLINNLNVKGDHGPAVIDEMKIELSDVKLSKVVLHGHDLNAEESDTTVTSRFLSSGEFFTQTLNIFVIKFKIFSQNSFTKLTRKISSLSRQALRSSSSEICLRAGTKIIRRWKSPGDSTPSSSTSSLKTTKSSCRFSRRT